MKVKAIAMGYHGSLREAGDEFNVPEGSKATWFEPVAAQEEKKAPKEPKSPKEPAKEPPLA